MYRLLISFFILFTFSSCRNKIGNEELYNKTSFIKIEPKVVNMGKISNQKIYKYDVILENNNSIPIIINKIDVSCNCIKVKLDNKNILPNKKNTLSLIINGKGNNGFFNKSIIIQSSANNKTEIIRVKGTFN